jgi:hypothetical protein
MYRNIIKSSDTLAFGCSHTWGVGVDADQTWAYLLGAKNFGVPGVSSDFVARTAPALIEQHAPRILYVLWPDWSRFEYQYNNEYRQSLVTDANRIDFMTTATDDWLQKNFTNQQTSVKLLAAAHNIKLVEMTLDDLIPYIDHADRWPLSKLGHHYSPVWHAWVADIFRKKENEQT